MVVVPTGISQNEPDQFGAHTQRMLAPLTMKHWAPFLQMVEPVGHAVIDEAVVVVVAGAAVVAEKTSHELP